MLGLLEALEAQRGSFNVFDFVADTRREFSSVLMVVKAAELLDLVRTPGDTVELTELGREVVRAEVNMRKALLNLQLQKMRLFTQFVEMIQRAPEGAISKDLAQAQLAVQFPSENPSHLFKTLVSWGRYGELLGYSASRALLYLDRIFERQNGELTESRHSKPQRQRPVKSAALPHEAAPLPEPTPLPEDVVVAAEEAGAAEQAPGSDGQP